MVKEKGIYKSGKIICSSRDDGGLGLPHIGWYHYAFGLKQLSRLLVPADQAPLWVSMEGDLTHPLPTQVFMTQTSGVNRYNNPILAFSQEIWQTSHKMIGTNPAFTYLTSIWNNSTLKIEKKKTISLGRLGKVGY